MIIKTVGPPCASARRRWTRNPQQAKPQVRRAPPEAQRSWAATIQDCRRTRHRTPSRRSEPVVGDLQRAAAVQQPWQEHRPERFGEHHPIRGVRPGRPTQRATQRPRRTTRPRAPQYQASDAVAPTASMPGLDNPGRKEDHRAGEPAADRCPANVPAPRLPARLGAGPTPDPPERQRRLGPRQRGERVRPGLRPGHRAVHPPTRLAPRRPTPTN